MNNPNDDSPSRGGPAPFCFPKRGVSRVAARHQGVLHGGRRTGGHLGIASQFLDFAMEELSNQCKVVFAWFVKESNCTGSLAPTLFGAISQLISEVIQKRRLWIGFLVPLWISPYPKGRQIPSLYKHLLIVIFLLFFCVFYSCDSSLKKNHYYTQDLST